MITILKNIQAELAKITTIRYIADNWGQLEIFNPPLTYPCALVDIDTVEYVNQMQGRQIAHATLMVTIADQPTQNISITAPQSLQEQANKIFAIISEVSSLLTRYRSPYHTPLNRVKLKKNLREDGIKEYTLSFDFSYTEELTEPMQYIGTKPKITVGS